MAAKCDQLRLVVKAQVERKAVRPAEQAAKRDRRIALDAHRALRNVLRDCRSELGPLGVAARADQDIRHLRMPVDDEVAARGRFVVARMRLRDGRVLEQRPRDRDPLALAARQQRAALADMGSEAAGQPLDHLVQPRGLRGRPHLGLGGVGPAVGDVVADRAVEQPGVLQHHADPAAQVVAAQSIRQLVLIKSDRMLEAPRRTRTCGAFTVTNPPAINQRRCNQLLPQRANLIKVAHLF